MTPLYILVLLGYIAKTFRFFYLCYCNNLQTCINSCACWNYDIVLLWQFLPLTLCFVFNTVCISGFEKYFTSCTDLSIVRCFLLYVIGF